MIQEIAVEENRVLIKFSGDIYMEDATRIRDSLMGYIEKGQINYIIDLGGVDYIDSSGLGALVAIHKRALQRGGHVVIKGLHGMVKELFILTRLDRVFKILK